MMIRIFSRRFSLNAGQLTIRLNDQPQYEPLKEYVFKASYTALTYRSLDTKFRPIACTVSPPPSGPGLSLTTANFEN
jgi:hypothetical protein